MARGSALRQRTIFESLEAPRPARYHLAVSRGRFARTDPVFVEGEMNKTRSALLVAAGAAAGLVAKERCREGSSNP